jgi:hypothetical protein
VVHVRASIERIATIGLALALSFPAHASDASSSDGRELRAAARSVKSQPWYPDGYYDVRIAAEVQAKEELRREDVLVGDCGDGARCYDLRNPLPLRINGDETDLVLVRYGNIALDVARLRQEMQLIGYPKRAYAKPLAAYERQLVDAADASAAPPPAFETDALRQLAEAVEENRARRASKLPRLIAADPPAPDGAKETPAGQSVIAVRATGPSAGQYPAGKRLRGDDRLVLRAGDVLVLLGTQGTRTLRGPGVFRADGPVTAPGAATTSLLSGRLIRRARTGAVRGGNTGPVVVATSPAGGEVLLISAFAFKLCTLKKLDSWDRFACRWNEVETGVGQHLSGRYVYQVKWPDGVVRKGTREIVPDYDGDDSLNVTFRKTGS